MLGEDATISDLLQPADLRALGVETDLDADALQTLLDGAEADVLAVAGAIDPDLSAAAIAGEEARRRIVLVQIAKLDLAYSGATQIASGAFTQAQLPYAQERARLLATLANGLFT